MNYQLKLGAWGSVFAVPSCVVDNYIKLASGNQLKVLLFMLKNAGATLRSEDIAAMTGVSPDEAEDALLFWENVGVLENTSGTLTPPSGSLEPKPAVPPIPAPVRPAVSAETRVKLTADPQFMPKEIAGAVDNNSAVRYLFETYERLAGRPTKHSERNTLMLLIEEVGLPCEVAVMLVEYCFSIDKASPAYMKSVALDWCESGIDTIEKAEERIKALQSRYGLENKLRGIFRMSSAFSKSQKEIISAWAELEISVELIEEAYDACMKNTGKLSFPYMDKVLRNWLDKGITTLEQIKLNKAAPKQVQEISMSSSFNIDELEQLAIAKYRKGGNGE